MELFRAKNNKRYNHQARFYELCQIMVEYLVEHDVYEIKPGQAIPPFSAKQTTAILEELCRIGAVKRNNGFYDVDNFIYAVHYFKAFYLKIEEERRDRTRLNVSIITSWAAIISAAAALISALFVMTH